LGLRRDKALCVLKEWLGPPRLGVLVGRGWGDRDVPGRAGWGTGVGWGPEDPELEVHSLSLVGRVFFSCVSVFFSLALSKLAISPMSGLSAIFLKQF
jgi:hypothetical protein